MLEISAKFRRVWGFVLGAALVLWGLLFWQLPDGRLHVYFLDVGQGDAIFINTPENHQILVDGGPQNFVMEELAEVMPFFDKTIDLMVLSHPHADHIDGLVEVLKRYEVGAVLFSGVDFGGGSYREFLEEILEQDIEVFVAESGVDFRVGSVVLDVVYPLRQVVAEEFKNLNNSSVALRVLYDNAGEELAIFLTGDMEEEAEEELVASGLNLQADVLKAGHHGSRSSSTLAFLERVRPEVVVIQAGENNQFGHPHEESLEKFERIGVKRVYRNDLDGRVELVFD
jgi:competence protein ComEC